MNKKIISIIVGLVAVFSVIVISVWGKAPESVNAKIPVMVLKFQYEANDDNEKVLSFVYQNENDTLQLVYKVEPENATNKVVQFTSSDERVLVDENGLVTFTEYVGGVLINIKSTDGTNKKDVVRITLTYDPVNPPIVDFD